MIKKITLISVMLVSTSIAMRLEQKELKEREEKAIEPPLFSANELETLSVSLPTLCKEQLNGLKALAYPTIDPDDLPCCNHWIECSDPKNKLRQKLGVSFHEDNKFVRKEVVLFCVEKWWKWGLAIVLGKIRNDNSEERIVAQCALRAHLLTPNKEIGKFIKDKDKEKLKKEIDAAIKAEKENTIQQENKKKEDKEKLRARIYGNAREQKQRQEMLPVIDENMLENMKFSCPLITGAYNEVLKSDNLPILYNKNIRRDLRTKNFSFNKKNTFKNLLEDQGAALVAVIINVIDIIGSFSYCFGIVLGVQENGKVVVQVYDRQQGKYVANQYDPERIGLYDKRAAQQEACEESLMAFLPEQITVPLYPLSYIEGCIGDIVGLTCIQYDPETKYESKEKEEFFTKMIKVDAHNKFSPKERIVYKSGNSYMHGIVMAALKNNTYKVMTSYGGVGGFSNYLDVPRECLCKIKEFSGQKRIKNISTLKALCADFQITYKNILEILYTETTAIYQGSEKTQHVIFFLDKTYENSEGSHFSCSEKNKFNVGEIVIRCSEELTIPYYAVLKQLDNDNYLIANLSLVNECGAKFIGKFVKEEKKQTLEDILNVVD